MGSIGCHREPGIATHDFFTKELLDNDPVKWGEFIKSRVVGDAFYAAHRLGEVYGEAAGQVVGVVVLAKWYGGYENYVYKSMSEDMGPYESQCPDDILDLLSPTIRDEAVEWRQRCRDNNARLRIARKVKKGDTVVFDKPIRFTNDDQLDTFVFEGRNDFRSGYARYRITGWRTMAFTHTPKPDPTPAAAA